MLLPGTPPSFDAAEAAVGGAVFKALTSQWTTTLATAQDVTGLEADVETGDIVLIQASLIIDAPAGGMKFALDCPAGSTIEGWIFTSGANTSSSLNGRVTAIDTLTASMAATARGTADIRLIVHVGSTGTIKLQACSTTATQTTIIDAGSLFEVEIGVEDAA